MKSALLLFALAAPAANAEFQPVAGFPRVTIDDGPLMSTTEYSALHAAVYWCVLESPVGNCLQLAGTNVKTGGTITDADGNDITVVGMDNHADTTYGFIGNWDTLNVQIMQELFYDEKHSTSKFALFNQDIGSWDVSSVTDMKNMFSGAAAFNQDISSWHVYEVQSFESMFDGASSFDQDISSWQVCGNGRCSSNAFTGMFNGASDFSHMLCGSYWVDNYALGGSNAARRLSAITFGNGGGIAETECDNLCPAGKWTNKNREQCAHGDLCREAECEFCPEGTYSEVMHLTNPDDCNLCPLNQESSADRTTCTSCPSGFVQQDGQCTACEAGKYVDGTQCVDCPAGTYSISGEGQTSSDVCLACAVGTINTDSGRTTECDNCPADKWTVGSGRTVCANVLDMLAAGGFESLDDLKQAGGLIDPDDCDLSEAAPGALAAAVQADATAYQMAGLCN